MGADCCDDPQCRSAGAEATKFKGEVQEDAEVCDLLSTLLSLTHECTLCLGKNGQNKGTINLCPACRVQMAQVLQLLETACTGKCSDTIISDYLCSSVQTMSGGGACAPLDLMHYLADTMYMGEGNNYDAGAYYGGMGHFGDIVRGWDLDAYDGSAWYNNELVQNDMFQDAGGYYGYTTGYNGYYDNTGSDYGSGVTMYNRKLAEIFPHVESIDNLDFGVTSHFCLNNSTNCNNEEIALTDFTDFTLTDQADNAEAVDNLTIYAKKLILRLSESIDPKPVVRVSILTRICDQVAELSDKDTYMTELLPMVGEQLNRYATAWDHKAGVLPIHPHCDADFEESLVRDAIKIEATDDSNQTSISCPPPVISNQVLQMRSLNGKWQQSFAKLFW